MTFDGTVFASLAFVLTVLGLGWTWVSWRRRGPTAGLRALAWTLVPPALWLTGTLPLILAVVSDLSRWATRLVFSPVTWLGLGVAAVSGALFVVSGALLTRGIGVRESRTPLGTRPQPSATPATTEPGRTKPGKQKQKQKPESAEALDDDIEAILKRHGIS